MCCLALQELGGSVEGWTDDLAPLFQLRDSLEGVVCTDDITVLQERLGLLQCQWKEVCYQVPSPDLVSCSTLVLGGEGSKARLIRTLFRKNPKNNLL